MCAGGDVGEIGFCGVAFQAPVVVVVFRLGLHLLGGVHVEVVVVVKIVFLLQGEVGAEVDVHLSLLAGVLGGDDDDTIGSACTIDGRSGGVFQHVDRLDVVDVEVGELAFHRQSVDDEQGRSLSKERGGTTNLQLTAIGRQTGHAAFEVGDEAWCVAILQDFAGHGGRSTRHVLFGDGLITGHDHFLERGAARHGDVLLNEGVASLDGHDGLVHADEAILQRASCGRNLQGIEAIDVGDGAHLRVVDADGDTWERFAVGIFHIAGSCSRARSRELTCDGHDVAIDVVLAIDLTHHFVEYLSDRLVLRLHRHLWQRLGELGTIHEVQACLIFHFREELLHGHLREVKRHGLVLGLLSVGSSCQA